MKRKTVSNIIIGTSLVGILSTGIVFGYNSLQKDRAAARLQTANYFAPQVANLDPLDMECYTEDMVTTTRNTALSRYALGGAFGLLALGSVVGLGTRTREEVNYSPLRGVPVSK